MFQLILLVENISHSIKKGSKKIIINNQDKTIKTTFWLKNFKDKICFVFRQISSSWKL